MIIKCLCLEERVESFIGKRGPVSKRVLTVMDSSREHRLVKTFDYSLSEEDCNRFPAGFLWDKRLEIAVKEVKLHFGGRLKIEGYIVTAPEPQAA